MNHFQILLFNLNADTPSVAGVAQFVHLIQFVETFIVACKDVIVCVPTARCTAEREQSAPDMWKTITYTMH